MREMVLIVDGSKKDRSFLACLLSDTYDVLEAADVREAASLLEMCSAGISLVLLNSGIKKARSDLEGLALLAVMRENGRTCGIPVILVKMAGSDASMIRRAYDLGAVESISLPCDEAVIKQRIKNVLALSAKSNGGGYFFDENDRRRIEQCRTIFQMRRELKMSGDQDKGGRRGNWYESNHSR